MIKANPLKLRAIQYLFCQNLEKVSSHLRQDKTSKIDKKIEPKKKIADFIKKNTKIRDIKLLKTSPLLLKTMQCPIINP